MSSKIEAMTTSKKKAEEKALFRPGVRHFQLCLPGAGDPAGGLSPVLRAGGLHLQPLRGVGQDAAVAPPRITFEGYKRVFRESSIATGYVNSVFLHRAGHSRDHLPGDPPTGYVMSKKTLPFRRVIMMFFVITMYFNGGLIPTYLVVSNLGLLNNVWALILPGGVSVYNVIVTRTFFESSIPGKFTRRPPLTAAATWGPISRSPCPWQSPSSPLW